MARLVSDPDLAFRLARAIVSDIALYNQEKVREGIEKDTLFNLMADDLQEGREHFKNRVDPTLENSEQLYDRAIVDVMVKQAGNVESRIW